MLFLAALLVLWSQWESAHTESIELRITDIAGLARHFSGQAEYAVHVQECSPLCSLMGLEILSEANSAHVISNEGITGRFRLSISLKRRTRPPPQERIDIPVEVVEQESHLSDTSVEPKSPADMSYSQQPLSNFEPYGRVLVTGASPGEKGNLNHNWRYSEEKIAEYTIDTTISAVRRCRKSCRFKSNAPFVKAILRNATLDNPSFRLQLAAIRDGSSLIATPRELLFAGYFAEAAERGSTEDLILPFQFPGRSDSDLSVPLASKDLTGRCNKYRFLATVGDQVAYVWRLSSADDRAEHDSRDHLDNGRGESGTIVVAFKDIPKSSSLYQHIWGRDELLPVAFAGSAPFDHFNSFGKVHKGFLNRYNQVTDELRTWLRPGANVLITGSFAGGAMAALAFADWLSDSNMGLGMTFGVTFGAAQVGDKLFQKAFRELGHYEPSKASYGYFEQLIAADERTGKVDISTRFPSTIFENFVSYPGVHSLDCLRTVLPVEKIVQSSPGHLRAFRPIGRRRFLYFGSHLRPALARFQHPKPLAPRFSRDGLQTLTSTCFTFQTNPMAHYMERLTSLYADSQRALEQSNKDNAPRFSKLRVRTNLPGHSVSKSTCRATLVPTPSAKLTLFVTTSSNLPLSNALGLGVNLCHSCSPHLSFNETLCHPMPHISNDTSPDYAEIQSSRSTSSAPLVFSTLRPIEGPSCVQLTLYLLQKSHTCATDMVGREMVRIASAPLLEMSEVLSCSEVERCGMEFEGMRVRIESRVEALVEVRKERKGGKEGILTREQTGVGRGGSGWIQGEELRGDGRKAGVENKDDREGEVVGERREAGGVMDGEIGAGDASEGWGEGKEDGLEMGGVKAGRDGEVAGRVEAVVTKKVGWGVGEEWGGVKDDQGVDRGLKGMGWGRKAGSENAGGKGGVAGSGVLSKVGNESGDGNRGFVEGMRRESGGVGRVWEREYAGMKETGGNLGVGQEGMGRLSGWNKGGGEGQAAGMGGRMEDLEKSGGCETEGWCYCDGVDVEGCVKEVEDGKGWCRVRECVEMKCGCGGRRVCEKKVGLVFEMVGGKGEVEGRCVGRVGRVVEELEIGG